MAEELDLRSKLGPINVHGQQCAAQGCVRKDASLYIPIPDRRVAWVCSPAHGDAVRKEYGLCPWFNHEEEKHE